MTTTNARGAVGTPERERAGHRANGVTGPDAAKHERRQSDPESCVTQDAGADQRAADKRWATIRARAALNGVSACRTDDDRGRPLFVLSKWAMTRQASSLEEVEAFLNRIDGSSI